MKGFVWLASYPKSGNTWMRALLTNLRRQRDRPAHINELHETSTAGARAMLDRYLPYETADVPVRLIDHVRPEVFRAIARQSVERWFNKVHDGNWPLPGGGRLFPADATWGAVYIVRNPLDVCGSFANHTGMSLEAAAEAMADPDQCMGGGRRFRFQTAQRLGTWSQHVRSWLDASGFPVHVVRYEDMVDDPVQQFSQALHFLQIDASPERVRQAVEFSRFETLKRQEIEHGFRERPLESTAFFRRGGYGGWRDTLPSSLAHRIIDDHREVMARLGYLDDHGRPVF